MSNQKSAYKRYSIIDRCLNNSYKKYWSKEDLLIALGNYDINISKRMLENDIHDMQHETGLSFQNAPIEYSRYKKGYFYAKSFSISIPVDEDDLRLLEKTAQALTQFKEIHFFNQFAGAVDKVVRLIKQIKPSNVDDTKPYILFEKVPYLRGYEHLDRLIEAIENKKTILLKYQKFQDSEGSELILSPYFVKEFHNRWYVIGFNNGKKGIRIYALDRILSLSTSDGAFVNNNWIDPESYFKDCIGINLSDNKVQKVILSFTPSQGHYIKTQYLHRSQEILVDNKKELRIQLNIIINKELKMILLGFGDSVRVIAPGWLASEIAETGRSVAALYCANSKMKNIHVQTRTQ